VTILPDGRPSLIGNVEWLVALDDDYLSSSENELNFFLKDCAQHYDDYLLIDGVHVVKKLGNYVAT
jgi:hypothetical protein